MTNQFVDRDRLVSAPDAYRARAQAAAGLVTTGAAAIAAGAIFGGAARLPRAAGVAAVVALVGLLVSIAYFVAAGLHSTQKSVPSDQLESEIREIVATIVRRMRIAAIAGLFAVLAFLFLVTVTVVDANRRLPVRLVLRDKAVSAMKSACPGLESDVLPGTLRGSQLTGDSTFVEIQVRPASCGNGVTSLQIARSDIAAISESGR